jgi:hypothetical protein
MFLAGLAALAAACGGGGSGGDGGGVVIADGAEVNEFCHTVSPQSSGCTGCLNVADSQNAMDGTFSTSATVAPGGSGTLRGSSAAGQAGGSIAGVSFYLPNPAGITIAVATLNGGNEQEAAAPVYRQNGSDNCSGLAQVCDFRDGQESFVGFRTLLPYDGIQATITNSSTGQVLVHELCVH